MQVRPISSTKCCNHHHTTIIILVMIRRCPASPSSRTTTPPMATTSPTWTGTPSLTVSCRWTSFQSTAPRQHHLRVWDITIPAQIASIPLGYNHPRILEALRDERNVKAMANRFGPKYRYIWTIITFPSLLVDNLSWWALIRPALGWFPSEDWVNRVRSSMMAVAPPGTSQVAKNIITARIVMTITKVHHQSHHHRHHHHHHWHPGVPHDVWHLQQWERDQTDVHEVGSNSISNNIRFMPNSCS